MLDHLESTENISAGKTEQVLGKIFDIFSKLVIDNSTGKPTLKPQLRENMIEGAWNFLHQNMHRNVDFEDHAELYDKFVLSKSCVDFLIAVSAKSSYSDADNFAKKMVCSKNLKRFCMVLRQEDLEAASQKHLKHVKNLSTSKIAITYTFEVH